MDAHPATSVTFGSAKRAPSASRLVRLLRGAPAVLLGWLRSAAIGAAVVGVMALGHPNWFTPWVLVACAMLGVIVQLACEAMQALTGAWVARLSGWPRRFALAGVFFSGGCIGWVISHRLSQLLFGFGLLPPGTPVLAMAGFVGAVGVVVGGVLTVYEVLRARIEASYAQLKDQEVARKELEIAGEVQRRLLPPTEIDGPGFAVSARHIPARWVAGDFYDVFRSGNGLVVAVADVAGKGMGASLIMASVKAMLPLVAAGRSAAATLTELNRRLVAELSPRQFVALAVVLFDPATGDYELANGGLPDPYLFHAGDDPKPLPSPGPRLPLGVRADLAYASVTSRLAPRDRILLLTDGLPEALTPADEPLGYDGFERLLGIASARDGGDRPATALARLVAAGRAATQPEQGDDWTLLLLERRSPAPPAA